MEEFKRSPRALIVVGGLSSSSLFTASRNKGLAVSSNIGEEIGSE